MSQISLSELTSDLKQNGDFIEQFYQFEVPPDLYQRDTCNVHYEIPFITMNFMKRPFYDFQYKTKHDFGIDQISYFIMRNRMISQQKIVNFSYEEYDQLLNSSQSCGICSIDPMSKKTVVVLHDFFQVPQLLVHIVNYLRSIGYSVVIPHITIDPNENYDVFPYTEKLKLIISHFTKTSKYSLIAQGYSAFLAFQQAQKDRKCAKLILLNPRCTFIDEKEPENKDLTCFTIEEVAADVEQEATRQLMIIESEEEEDEELFAKPTIDYSFGRTDSDQFDEKQPAIVPQSKLQVSPNNLARSSMAQLLSQKTQIFKMSFALARDVVAQSPEQFYRIEWYSENSTQQIMSDFKYIIRDIENVLQVDQCVTRDLPQQFLNVDMLSHATLSSISGICMYAPLKYYELVKRFSDYYNTPRYAFTIKQFQMLSEFEMTFTFARPLHIVLSQIDVMTDVIKQMLESFEILRCYDNVEIEIGQQLGHDLLGASQEGIGDLIGF